MWDELDDFFEDDVLTQGTKHKKTSRKRKWREIENIKEQRRLKKELADINQYSF